MWEKFIVIEDEIAVYVTSAADPDDWVVCFHKSATFPARDWAERMAYLYNTHVQSQVQAEAGSLLLEHEVHSNVVDRTTMFGCPPEQGDNTESSLLKNGDSVKKT